jgi:putative oxidoreductase
LRRLFSTFAPGWPGVGLLLMRLVAGASLVIHGFARLQTEPSVPFIVLAVSAIGVGILLLAGLWTPIAGMLVAALALWNVIIRPGNPSACIFMATIGAALALVGPGAWSLDARIFGWKRIDVRGPTKDSF